MSPRYDYKLFRLGYDVKLSIQVLGMTINCLKYLRGGKVKSRNYLRRMEWVKSYILVLGKTLKGLIIVLGMTLNCPMYLVYLG